MNEFTREDIENFLSAEKLKYQKIKLPFGFETPGHPRNQIKEVLFSDPITGCSMLDVGSYLGGMCIAALQNGAKKVVGLELNRDKIRQAKRIAEFLDLSPEYRHQDVEKMHLSESFDLILLLNVLHHFFDPVAVLRKLTKKVKQRLIIEAATLGGHDARKIKLGTISKQVFKSHPSVYVESYHPGKLNQTYFFSSHALARILSEHMKCYWRIDCLQSEFKQRFILDCKKLSIGRMILVSGCNSSGKSTFCDMVMRNEFASELDYKDYSQVVFTSPSKLWGKELDSIFPEQHTGECLMHYDLSLVEKFKLHSFDRDPSTSVIQCAEVVDAVLIAPSLETLKKQLYDSELKSSSQSGKFHVEELERFGKADYLLNIYSDWLGFLDSVESKVRIHIYSEAEQGRKLYTCSSFCDARNRIRGIYAGV